MQEIDENSSDEKKSFLGINTPVLFAVMEVVETCVMLLFFAYAFIHLLGFYNNLTNQNFFIDSSAVVNLLLEAFVSLIKYFENIYSLS